MLDALHVRRDSDDDIQLPTQQLIELMGLRTTQAVDSPSVPHRRSSASGAGTHTVNTLYGDGVTASHTHTHTHAHVDTHTGVLKEKETGLEGVGVLQMAPEPPRPPVPVKPSMSSQNYEDNESEVARLYEVEQHKAHRHFTSPSTREHSFNTSHTEENEEAKVIRRRTRNRSLIRWLINLLMAVTVESIYLFISFTSSSLLKDKANWMAHHESAGAKYMTKLSFSLLYAAMAFMCVYFVPTSAGSGIPETKAFLNGIRIPNMQSLRTLTAKMFGTIFAVSAGLPLGKYGPMIHIGSIVAAFMSRGARGIKQVNQLFDTFRIFSTHTEKRDLVVSGTAAGVTAAFGAPIGGLMMAWEEGSSYWSLKVSWRVFFCAMTTLLFTHLVAETKPIRESKFINQSYVESYAGSFSTGIRVANRDLVVFAIMGVMGGIMGAGFITAHKHMTMLRGKYVASWNRKFAEVMAVTFLVITIGFVASYFSEGWACRTMPPTDPRHYEDAAYVTPYFSGLLRLTCPHGMYNEVASLYQNDGVTAMRLIFHLPRINPADGSLMFSSQALLLFVIPYFCLMITTFGIAVPSGFFVPQLLIGAVMGRLMGELFIQKLGFPTYFGQVRIFAIMGSAAFVGGISRMVLSMTLIMLEATGDLFFLVPFAVVLIISHWVGDFFTPSIYDMIIEMKGYPFLKPDPPKWAMGVLRASDVMTRQVKTLRPIERVKTIRDMLYATEHNMHALIYPDGHPRAKALFGTIMRETLVVLLQAAAFSSEKQVNTDPDCTEVCSPVLSFPVLLKHASRLSNRKIARPTIHLSVDEEELWVDLRPYANPSIYYVTEDSSVVKVYRVFRGLGLRHLLVLDPQRNISGIITRKDLMVSSLRKRVAEIRSGKHASGAAWALPDTLQHRLITGQVPSSDTKLITATRRSRSSADLDDPVCSGVGGGGGGGGGKGSGQATMPSPAGTFT